MPLIYTRTAPTRDEHAFGTIGSGGAAANAVGRSARDLPVVLRRELATCPTEMNPLKGAFGEHVAQRLLGHGSATVEWVEPLRRSGQGIDLLSIERGASGRNSCVRVYEVKFGSSRLGSTRDGRQLGEAWTARRLRENAEQLRVRAAQSPDGSVARALRRQANELMRAATGESPLERHVVRVTVRGGGFQITVQGNGEAKSRELVAGRFHELPAWARRSVQSGFEETFRSHGCNAEEARRLAREACRNPEFFRAMSRDRRWTWRAGMDRHSAQASLAAATVAAALRALFDLWSTGRVDWRGVALSGLLGGAAGFAGAYAGVQTVTALTATQLGRALSARFTATAVGRVVGVVGLGRFAGGLIGAAVFAYGGALLGLTDWRTANRSMSAATIGAGAGFGATGATFGIAVMFGTAGTGTAIGSLSGAAMVNAALAWLGGGTIASGGFGMAGGLLVLSGVGAVFVVAGGAAVTSVYRWLDERERRAMIEGRIELARLTCGSAA